MLLPHLQQHDTLLLELLSPVYDEQELSDLEFLKSSSFEWIPTNDPASSPQQLHDLQFDEMWLNDLQLDEMWTGSTQPGPRTAVASVNPQLQVASCSGRPISCAFPSPPYPQSQFTSPQQLNDLHFDEMWTGSTQPGPRTAVAYVNSPPQVASCSGRLSRSVLCVFPSSLYPQSQFTYSKIPFTGVLSPSIYKDYPNSTVSNSINPTAPSSLINGDPTTPHHIQQQPLQHLSLPPPRRRRRRGANAQAPKKKKTLLPLSKLLQGL